MRRRLPAGLRWRLLLALLATSAVTLGVTALVVLPPMQDRLRTQSADGPARTPSRRRATSFEAVFTELDEEPEPSQYDVPHYRLWQDRYEADLPRRRTTSPARPTPACSCWTTTLMPGDPRDSPPGLPLRQRVHEPAAARDARRARGRCARAR